MEYNQRQELRSKPISERTSIMMRSVREILAEQGQEHLLDPESFQSASEAPTMPPRAMPGAATAAATAAAADKGGIQRPPHMTGVVNPALNKAVRVPAPSPFRSAAPETAPAPKSRSLLSRLIGR